MDKMFASDGSFDRAEDPQPFPASPLTAEEKAAIEKVLAVAQMVQTACKTSPENFPLVFDAALGQVRTASFRARHPKLQLEV